MTHDVGLRIARNSLANIVRAVIVIPVFLLITPYIIRHVGAEQYGLWALVGVITSYAQLSDFGINESLIKHYAEFRSRDVRKMNQLINTAAVSYLVLGVLCTGVFLLLMPLLVVEVFQVPEHLQPLAQQLFLLAVILFCVNMVAGVFGALQAGFEQMHYTSAVAVLSTIASAAGAVAALSAGYGILGMMYINAAVALYVSIVNIAIARKLFPQLEFNPFRHFDGSTLRQIFGFSWKVQISMVTQLMIFQMDSIFLSHFVGLKAVGFYEVANRLASQIRNFIIVLFGPVSPASSSLQADGRTTLVSGLYRRSFKFMTLASVPVFLTVMALAHPILKTWMGDGYDISAYTLQILMAAYLINVLTGPGAFILSGINLPQVGMRTSIAAGLLNLALCILLVPSVGYFGVAVSVFVSLGTTALYFLRMVNQRLAGADLPFYRQTLRKPFSLAGMAAVAILLTDSFVPLSGYGRLFLAGSCALGMIYGVLLQDGYLDDYERSLLRSLLPLRKQGR
ncbi:MAG: flippase [Nitrospiraceae bacterium]|nr:flippase [Nitrospiraceae bacterium]